MSVGAPFPSFCYLPEEVMQLSKEDSQRRFLQETWELKIAMGSWFWAY